MAIWLSGLDWTEELGLFLLFSGRSDQCSPPPSSPPPATGMTPAPDGPQDGPDEGQDEAAAAEQRARDAIKDAEAALKKAEAALLKASEWASLRLVQLDRPAGSFNPLGDGEPDRDDEMFSYYRGWMDAYTLVNDERKRVEKARETLTDVRRGN